MSMIIPHSRQTYIHFIHYLYRMDLSTIQNSCSNVHELLNNNTSTDRGVLVCACQVHTVYIACTVYTQVHCTMHAQCTVHVYHIGLTHDCTIIMHCIGPPTEVSPLCWEMDKTGMEFRIESVVVYCNLDRRTASLMPM